MLCLQKTHNVDIRARVGDSQILSVMRKAQPVDRMAVRDVRRREMKQGEITHSQQVMVLAHIHSVTSNRFTIESCPPDAMYFPLGS